MLKELKKEVEKLKETIYEENGNTYKDIENLKKSQKEILNLKITITEMKNSLEGFRSKSE